tara:strand:+ start:487 stop:873 length:387 start_codon:yes stop_codon:yes gene_type:complete
MSTRAIIRFATREEGVSFSEIPEKHYAQLYRHQGGYPDGLGLVIADSIINGTAINSLSIDSLDTKHEHFVDYIYYVWQHLDKSTWISIFKVDYTHCHMCGRSESGFNSTEFECIFVGTPEMLQTKYDR